MKKAILKSVKFLMAIIISIYLFNSCTEEFDYGKSVNAVKTLESSSVLQTAATVSGLVNTDNGSSLIERGICYDTSSNPTITNLKKTDALNILGSFSCSLNKLSPSTTYYARAYATNNFGTAYGTEISFKTQAATVPIIQLTTAANSITSTSAKSGGTITNDGASSVTSRGICYSNSISVPTISDLKTNDGTSVGTFTSALSNLTPNTRFYIRAYATNAIGTAYGDVKTFSTTTATVPTGITTTSLAFITQSTATGGGSIIGDGGSTITSRGICWSNITTSPTITNSKTIDGNGVGTFTSFLTTLTPNTTYYVRAYATNSVGTAYGNVLSFTTVAGTVPSGISTTTLSSITQTTASSGGSVSNDGGASITSRGVCWSNTTASPTITNTKTTDGTGIGTFSSSLTGLLPGTTYYVRSYATNSIGTVYGTVRSFTTTSATIPIGITTTSISSITQVTASSGGSITDDGGATMMSKGVCWSSTTSMPTINDSKTNNGTSIGSFTSSLTGLLPNTTYYVRAYATNSIGSAYGNVRTFTTLAPSLSIGQSYQGGIIAYIFQSGDTGYVMGQTHGIITTTTQSTGVIWGCSGTSISTNTSIGTGQSNTAAIVNGCLTSNTAARLCNNLSSGGYSDWYLPSLDELNKLYLNRTAIGGFSSTWYWSSSQSSSTSATLTNFSNGTNGSGSKTGSYSVRPVRNF